MKLLFFIFAMLFSVIDCTALSMSLGIKISPNFEENNVDRVVVKKQNRKKVNTNVYTINSDLYLLKIGLLLTVGISIAIGVLLFQPIFILA